MKERMFEMEDQIIDKATLTDHHLILELIGGLTVTLRTVGMPLVENTREKHADV